MDDFREHYIRESAGLQILGPVKGSPLRTVSLSPGAEATPPALCPRSTGRHSCRKAEPLASVTDVFHE